MYLCLLLMYSVLSSYYQVISSLFEFKINNFSHYRDVTPSTMGPTSSYKSLYV